MDNSEKAFLFMFTTFIGYYGSLFFGVITIITFFEGPAHGFNWEFYFFIFLACIANILFSWVILNGGINEKFR